MTQMSQICIMLVNLSVNNSVHATMIILVFPYLRFKNSQKLTSSSVRRLQHRLLILSKPDNHVAYQMM